MRAEEILPEDFIVNKVAGLDRDAQLMSKTLESVLVRQAGKLDNGYMTKRARQAEVHKTLQTIQ